jgi:ferrochelatase
VKVAIILFNLGGPDSLDAVEPFLRNLFGDPAILRVPTVGTHPHFIAGLARLVRHAL